MGQEGRQRNRTGHGAPQSEEGRSRWVTFFFCGPASHTPSRTAVHRVGSGGGGRTPQAPSGADTRRIVFVRHGESQWNEVFNKGFGPSFIVRLVKAIIGVLGGDAGTALGPSHRFPPNPPSPVCGEAGMIIQGEGSMVT